MSDERPASGSLAAVAVVFTVVGMLVGTALLFATPYRSLGWLLFMLSFGGWLAAALLALREGWHRGWFDR